MSPRSRMEYLEAIYLRYKKVSFKEKSMILAEFCLNYGYHRKHAIRLLYICKKGFRCTTARRRKTLRRMSEELGSYSYSVGLKEIRGRLRD